jgi:anion-transporting  ArsA/GET3 family ATPase
MEPAQFFTASRVLIVAGKGGVGKTTVAASLGRAAARLGIRALLVEVEGKSTLAAAMGLDELGYEDRVAPPEPEETVELTARGLTPERALRDYLDRRGLTRALRRLQGQRILDLLANSTPGVNDLLVLGKIKQLERAGDVDVIIVDAPAAGHAVTFLRSAVGVLDSVESGPVRDQAEEVDAMLTDPARCQVLLVTLAEETPVNEAIETAYRLEEDVGIKLGPIIVNALRPEITGLDLTATEAARASGADLDRDLLDALEAARRFRSGRAALERDQLNRLDRLLPLEQLRLPYLSEIGIGPAQIAILSTDLIEQLGELSAPVDVGGSP